ncbi:MAG: hypothetical protein GDA48_12095 [Hormoscilla sp. GM102CHS1]|nr:hypothetical protein [Hormoscilla sp. GM102CHS1]MBO1348447.1 hypothetical protein [Hormoscilla sp. GUM202]
MKKETRFLYPGVGAIGLEVAAPNRVSITTSNLYPRWKIEIRFLVPGVGDRLLDLCISELAQK